ncbi:ImmA/IrrE family metallo-endopeptidase [Micromonospora aurantiaca (nom. illeg.)]|uniref:ImmA/IrrE family metallo-endopeptidase n=1 Tax=Micromonospora aurantiaca (nom. illeg.) TaxID=47850 RepID=UPI0033D4C511
MGKRLPKAEIQRRAIDIRKTDLGLTEHDRLCPYELAHVHGVAVHALDSLAEMGCPEKSVTFYASERPEAWSAALVPAGTGQFIVENTSHQPRRRRFNVAHEMAHVLLEHEFDRVMFSAEGRHGCANPTSKDQEWEAQELGAELLLPLAAAYKAARERRNDEQVADLFDVSLPVARWRMNGTGARIVAQRAAAKRAKSGKSW